MRVVTGHERIGPVGANKRGGSKLSLHANRKDLTHEKNLSPCGSTSVLCRPVVGRQCWCCRRLRHSGHCPRYNFIANQLVNGDQRLNAALTIGVADQAAFTKWNPSARQFLPYSFLSASTATWSINYTFDLGEGGILALPSSSSAHTFVTFVGGVHIYTNILGNEFGPGDRWAPGYANGKLLISCPVPVAGRLGLDNMLYNVTGRTPMEGERVGFGSLDGTVSTVSTFIGGSWEGCWRSDASGRSAGLVRLGRYWHQRGSLPHRNPGSGAFEPEFVWPRHFSPCGFTPSEAVGPRFPEDGLRLHCGLVRAFSQMP
jgi:hypothetical protein